MADRRLQVFHAVAKQMSFTKAAETLFMTQPAVTFQIKQLEEHLNARLFERGHGKIALTPAGDVVLEYAERILALSAELETRLREMTGRLSGPLLIGASTTIAEFLLPRVLGEFKSRHPDVQPKLTVANSETIENRVAEHTLDLGLIEAPSHLPALLTEVCCEDELQVIVAPAHPLAKLKSVAPKQLVPYPYVSRETGSGTREFTDLYFRKAGIAPGRSQRGDGARQPGGAEGRRRYRPRLRHPVQGHGREGTAARRPGGDAARAAADARALARLSQGEVPVAPGEHLRRFREGAAEGRAAA